VGRIVAFDVGERRIGVAISDATCTLARPVGTLQVARLDAAAVGAAANEVARLAAEDDGVERVVVGLPRRLDGTANEMTPRVERFAHDLGLRTQLPITLQDERLTSHEAESRLSVREKDWRARKKRLDAAAAAIILQDYLDTRPGRPVLYADTPEF
jgi:putative Holliday junction resolvase